MEILQILKANNVPLNRMVDIRSNPDCGSRSKRWCAGPSSRQHRRPRRPSLRPRRRRSPGVLQELETLHASGAMTEQEYRSRRAQIISRI
jgi:hypothetical protein